MSVIGHNSAEQICGFIVRILRLKAQQDDLAEDIRAVYGEVKDAGLDKTAIGEVVAHLRKREKKGADALRERTEIFETYLSTWESHAHAHARARAREDDRADGGVTIVTRHSGIRASEPDSPPSPAATAPAGSAAGEIPVITDSHPPVNSSAQAAKPGQRPSSRAVPASSDTPGPRCEVGADGHPSEPGSDAGRAKMEAGCRPPPGRGGVAESIRPESEQAVTDPYAGLEIPEFLDRRGEKMRESDGDL